MYRRASTLAAALCCFAALPAVHAQLPPRAPGTPAPQAPPPPKLLKDDEIAKKLIELEKMSKDLDESKFGYNSKIIRELREVGASGDKAFALWLDCKKEYDFDQKGKTAAQWAEWKRTQTKDANHDRDIGLQISVRWLSIVLMYLNARSDSARNEAINEAVTFLDTAVERIKKVEKEKDAETTGRERRYANGSREGEGEMDQDVLNSLFAKHYKLDATVNRKDAAAAFVPGDVGGIYEKMILPFYRSMKQYTNLMNSWKRRIEQETTIADAKRGNGPMEKFKTEKLPQLKWGQAVDYFRMGQEESATAAMIAHIKTYMTHPRASEWIIELTALLKKEELPQLAQEKSPGKSAPVPVPAAPALEPDPASVPPPAPEPVKDAKTTPPAPSLVDPTKPLVDPTKESP